MIEQTPEDLARLAEGRRCCEDLLALARRGGPLQGTKGRAGLARRAWQLREAIDGLAAELARAD